MHALARRGYKLITNDTVHVDLDVSDCLGGASMTERRRAKGFSVGFRQWHDLYGGMPKIQPAAVCCGSVAYLKRPGGRIRRAVDDRLLELISLASLLSDA